MMADGSSNFKRRIKGTSSEQVIKQLTRVMQAKLALYARN